MKGPAAPQSSSEATPSYKMRAWLKRHEDIVQAAHLLMSERGFTLISVEDVSAAVGISRPTFYIHFESKEHLGAEVLVRMVDGARSELARLAERLAPDAAVRTMVDWMFDTQFRSENKFDHARALVLLSHERVIAAEKALADAIAQQMIRAQEAGAMPSTWDARFMAQTVLSILKDPVHESDFRNGQLDVAALKRHVHRLIF